MSDENEQNTGKVEQAAAILGAAFTDYVIIARLKTGDMAVVYSNEVYADGAAHRLIERIKTKAFLVAFDELSEKRSGEPE